MSNSVIHLFLTSFFSVSQLKLCKIFGIILFVVAFVEGLHAFKKLPRTHLSASQASRVQVFMNGYERRHGDYLARIVQRKKAEVDNLLRRHGSIHDPLVMRMSYVNNQCKYHLAKALKKPDVGPDELGKMSVIVDVKRQSPTIPLKREVVDYTNAGEYCQLLAKINVDGLLFNTEREYGGKFQELKEASDSLQSLEMSKIPPLIHKDIIIHPIQIAQSLESGASGVLLILSVVGTDLETLLDSCTIMGTEALVEVHTPNELEYALEKGATMFLVNMWDRLTGQLIKNQAKYLTSMIPRNCIALAGGDIRTISQVMELGAVGYDGVVLGRNIANLPDIKEFVDRVHSFVGPPRAMGMGMKCNSWSAGA